MTALPITATLVQIETKHYNVVTLNFSFLDWSLGCFKQNTSFSASCFNVTAGDYDSLVNMTGEACVSACSALNISNKLAGLTASGVCMCSQSDDSCLQNTSNVSCLYPQSDGWYYKVYRVAQLPTLKANPSVSTFDLFNVTIASAGEEMVI